MRKLFYKGESLQDLSKRTGINFYTLRYRIIRGLSEDKILLRERIQSFDAKNNIENRFWNFTRKSPGCWLWNGPIATSGYGYLTISFGGKGIKKNRQATHISFEIKHGKRSIGNMMVLHSCDRPLCVNPDHLSLGNHFDNMKDMTSKGRQCRGEEQWKSFLNEESVKKIRSLFLDGRTREELAKSFNVSTTTIRNVVNRKT